LRPRGIPRLAVRFLISNRHQNAVLGFAIAVAVAGGLLLVSAGQSVVGRVQDEAQQRYGTAQLTVPSNGPGTTGGGGWIDARQTERIAHILRVESVTVYPRVQSEGLLVSEDGFATVNLVSETRTRIAALAGDAGVAVPGVAAGVSLLVGYSGMPPNTGNDTAGFINLDDVGVSWIRDARNPDLVWVDTDSLLRAFSETGIAPASAVGNVLIMGTGSNTGPPDDRSPAVIAYNAAELLAAEFPQATVRSRLELAGRIQEMSAENISLLLRIALVLPAIAAIVGIVLVTAESRSDEVTLLRTMGFDAPRIRGLFVREVFMVGVAATLVALVLALGVGALIPSLTISAQSIAGVVIVGVFLPPGLAFLTARRFLTGRLGDRLAEFRR
jgi:FtsX-like permease family protein